MLQQQEVLMPFWDFFKRGKSKGPAISRPVKRNLSRLSNKWIDAAERYNAMDRLLEMGTDESYQAVLNRFTFQIENTIKDNEEKQYLYNRIIETGGRMIESLRRYLHKEEEISWPLRALSKLVGEHELVDFLVTLLLELDPFYSSKNQKKVILLDVLREYPGEKVFKGVAPFLEDTDDDVRTKAIETVAHRENEAFLRELLIGMAIEETERPRIRRKALEELARLEWDVKGFHNAISNVLPDGFYMDRKNRIKMRERPG